MFTEPSCSVDMIYLNFSKAFDKVDHGVLLHKLRDMGIAGNLGIWFHSFLSNRYLQRRRERYIIIYVWKILENLVPNLVKPLQFYVSDRRGRLCSVSHVRLGHTGTLAYSSFRWKSIRLFNSLPMRIRNITACPPLVSKKQLDLHLSPILDCPCTPNFNNSLDNKY